jgi:C-terminal processing protease CtpA/Prc
VAFVFNNVGSLNSCGVASSSANVNQVSHSESIIVSLKCNETCTFGFTLQMGIISVPSSQAQEQQQQQQQLPTPSSASYPIIGYIEPNSPAEKSDILQAGDRILAINGNSLFGLNVDEARSMIKESGSQLSLEIEFDVAGTYFEILRILMT